MNAQEPNVESKAGADQTPAPANFDAALPTIVLPGNGVSLTVAARRLFSLMANDGAFFVRGGRIVKFESDDEGTPVLNLVTSEQARSAFEKAGNLFVWRVGEGGRMVLKPTVCSSDTAKGLMAADESKSLLPHIRGLMNCPILTEQDGILHVLEPGYDADTKMYVTAGTPPEEVPLQEATGALLSLLSEFDFQTEADRARAMVSWISPALKVGGFINGPVPADVAEADRSQSGKTYRQKVGVAFYNEKVSLVTKTQGGVGSVDEKFSQQLEKGRPFVQFDNFRGLFDSANLEAFMTAEGSFPCRIPHKGYFDVRPEDYFILLSSNGVETTRDFANRSNIIRIRKKPDGFHFRKYPEGDLLQHVRANQAYYLGCIFAVVRAWHAAGKPRTNETRHDFRDWVQVVDWIAQNIFKMCPVMEGHRQAQERVSNPNLCLMREVALVIDRTEQLGFPQTATDIAQVCELNAIKVPGARQGAETDVLKKLIGSSFGRLFGNTNSLDSEGYRINRDVSKRPREDGRGYEELKSYAFYRLGPDCPPPAPPRELKEKHVVSFAIQKPDDCR